MCFMNVCVCERERERERERGEEINKSWITNSIQEPYASSEGVRDDKFQIQSYWGLGSTT